MLKNTETFHSIKFYRTRDGAEVDFIIDDMIQKISIEVKYKSLKKAVFYKALNNFNIDENISQSFIVNLQLNTTQNNIHYIPAYLTEKIFT